MFPAYNAGGGGPSKQMPGPSNDLNSRTRYAVQIQAKKNLINEKNQLAQENEDAVFQQCGYGESSSDDECGGVRMKLEPNQQVAAEHVFTLPEKLKPGYGSRKSTTARIPPANSFHTFPDRPARNPYSDEPMEVDSESSTSWGRPTSSAASSSYSSRRRSRSRESSRRRRGDSRSRSRRDRSDDSRRRSKKKKSRRHRSSSSESSSSDSESRSSRRSSRRRESPKRKSAVKRPKYEFLTLKEDYEILDLSAQILIRDTKFDPENYTLGCPKREVASMYLGCYQILGLEKEHNLFETLYAGEVRKVKKELGERREFYKQLAEAAAHVPSEKYFRKTKKPAEGYWKLVQKKDILNQDDAPLDADSAFQTDAFIERINVAKQAYRNNITDVDALKELIHLEVEQSEQNKGSFMKVDSRALAERHLDMVEKAIKASRMVHTLQLLKCDLMKKTDVDVERILEEYRMICEKFPHEPMVWVKYLDYIQYDSNAYDAERLHQAFDLCLKKVDGLAHKTLLSHVGHVKDWPAFRYFHLAVYIRYLKWLLHCGQTPRVLANIQATMEYNLGFAAIEDHREREEAFRNFWNSGLPRIGDDGGIGGMNHAKIRYTEEAIQKFEKDRYFSLLAEFRCHVREHLGGREACKSKKWVAFERKMLELDAKCKRVDFKNSEAYQEAARNEEDVMSFELWDLVEYPSLKVFRSSCHYELLDYLQPLLELLGVKFMHSSGCFTTTEQVISEWIPRDMFASSHANFHPTPQYSESACLDVGKKILKYLINNRHEITQKSPRVLDQILIRYMLALIEMKFQYRDRQMIYYQMKPAKMVTLLKDVFENDDEIKKILENYPRMRHSMAVIVGDKMTTWFERGIAEETRLERLNQLRETMDLPECQVLKKHIVTDVSRGNLRKYQTKLWEYLTNFTKDLDVAGGTENNRPKSLQHPQIAYPTLQIQLYSRILQARNYIIDERTAGEIRLKLAADVMGMDEIEQVDVLNGMSQNQKLHQQMKTSMETLVRMIGHRDEIHGNAEGIPEFPRAKALCEALDIALDFVFLDQILTPRQSINEMTARIERKCDEFDKSQMDWNRGAADKYRDRVDLQFILETAITFFSQKNLSVTYHKNYEDVILKASMTFSCETKYMKRIAEMYATNRFQWMKIRRIIGDRNKELQRKMETQFNIQIERRLLQNSMTTMFTTMRICEKIGEGSWPMLVKNWMESAKELRDPTVWRLVMGVADKVSGEMVEETFIRANGNCPWALNLQLDYVEKMPKKLRAQLVHILSISKGQLHGVFIEDLILLNTYHEIMEARFQTERLVKQEEGVNAVDSVPAGGN